MTSQQISADKDDKDDVVESLKRRVAFLEEQVAKLIHAQGVLVKAAVDQMEDGERAKNEIKETISVITDVVSTHGAELRRLRGY